MLYRSHWVSIDWLYYLITTLNNTVFLLSTTNKCMRKSNGRATFKDTFYERMFIIFNMFMVCCNVFAAYHKGWNLPCVVTTADRITTPLIYLLHRRRFCKKEVIRLRLRMLSFLLKSKLFLYCMIIWEKCLLSEGFISGVIQIFQTSWKENMAEPSCAII